MSKRTYQQTNKEQSRWRIKPLYLNQGSAEIHPNTTEVFQSKYVADERKHSKCIKTEMRRGRLCESLDLTILRCSLPSRHGSVCQCTNISNLFRTWTAFNPQIFPAGLNPQHSLHSSGRVDSMYFYRQASSASFHLFI